MLPSVTPHQRDLGLILQLILELNGVEVKLVDCQENWVAWKVGHTAKGAGFVDVVIIAREWMIVTMEVCCCVMVVNVLEASCRDRASWAVLLVVAVSSLDW